MGEEGGEGEGGGRTEVDESSVIEGIMPIESIYTIWSLSKLMITHYDNMGGCL